MQDNTKTEQFPGCHLMNCVNCWVQTSLGRMCHRKCFKN